MPSQTMSQKQNQQITRGELRANDTMEGREQGEMQQKRGGGGVGRVFNAGSLTN